MHVRQEFQVHLLNADGVKKAIALGEVFSNALNEIEQLVPEGAERTRVVELLQLASFWAKRGMAVDPHNQDGR